MGTIDRFDYEAGQKRERKNYGFTVNFKKIYMHNNDLMEDNSDWDENYPKNIFINELLGIWIGLVVLIILSHGIVWLVSLPFLFFYGMAFFSTYKAWKEYQYAKGRFWFISLAGLLLALAVGLPIQFLAWGLY